MPFGHHCLACFFLRVWSSKCILLILGRIDCGSFFLLLHFIIQHGNIGLEVILCVSVIVLCLLWTRYNEWPSNPSLVTARLWLFFPQEPWKADNKRPDSSCSASWGPSMLPRMPFQPLFRNVCPSPNDAGAQSSLPSHRIPWLRSTTGWRLGLTLGCSHPQGGADAQGWPGAPSCPWESWWTPRHLSPGLAVPWHHFCILYYIWKTVSQAQHTSYSELSFPLIFYPKSIYYEPIISNDKLLSHFGRIFFS